MARWAAVGSVQITDEALAPAEGRSRPVAHFTARRGWVNDPYGVQWDGTRYHMWYQTVPEATDWSPACAWGHAVSADLVGWEERGLALVPQPHEAGCWSGCLVSDTMGARRAFYTRVQLDDLEAGSIAVARGDESGAMTSGVDDVVVPGPPDDIPITAFRDPYVWRERDGWTMIVGAGTADGDGAVLQYRSTDLDRWRYTGVLCRGRVATADDVSWQVWECPQLIDIDGVWLLVVSVQCDGRAGQVAAATGGYDGARFVPRRWQRLAFGTAPYATSVFRDRDGRPCMISWLQEDLGPVSAARGWAGAQSLVSELAIDNTGRVIAAPHPNLTTSTLLANRTPPAGPCVHDLRSSASGLATHLTVSTDDAPVIEVRQGQRRVGRVTRSRSHPELQIERLGR
ncbi:MAG: glycoside hydrolase family 32 protein, partial [Solirubrobacteraceae bacterium]